LVLFRIVQEALTNVARHSNSPTACIRLARRPAASGDIVELTVEDAGQGMPQARPRASLRSSKSLSSTQGVGLASMRERLAQIGGHLEIESATGRTCIRAIIKSHSA
jgi:signal transduction histidine kinase